MKNVIIGILLAILLSVTSYAQYKEPKLRNNLNIYKKERESKKIAVSAPFFAHPVAPASLEDCVNKLKTTLSVITII